MSGKLVEYNNLLTGKKFKVGDIVCFFNSRNERITGVIEEFLPNNEAMVDFNGTLVAKYIEKLSLISSAGPKSQIGGNHYCNKAIQPIEYINSNNLDFNQGNIVKYVTRHKEKDKDKDILKVMHYATFILKYDYGYTDEQIKEACDKVKP